MLKNYFRKWTRNYILKKLFRKQFNKKRINNGINIINSMYLNRIYKLFIGKLENLFLIKKIEDLKKLFEDFKKNIFIRSLLSLGKKLYLYKNFNIYKNKINSKMILEKLKEYEKNKLKINIPEKNINKEIPKYYFLNNKFITNIPIDNNFIKNELNFNNDQSNNCFIINNLNYNNNTNNIDIRLNYDNNIQNIQSKINEFINQNTKQNKFSIGLYKKNNKQLFQNISNEFINKQNINTIPHSQIFPGQKQNNNNNLNKSLILSKHTNKLNWDLITKNNQLIMIINIIERHRKLKNSKLLNKYFEIWKNTNSINDNGSFLKNNKPIQYKKKYNGYKNNINKNLTLQSLKITSLNSEFNKDSNQLFTSSLPDLSDIKSEKVVKNSVYKKKSIIDSFNSSKKNKNIYDDINHGYMSPENNYYTFTKFGKIEEMEISFGHLNQNRNYTNPIESNKKRKYGNIKYIKPFISDDKKEIKVITNDNDIINNIIIEDINENNEYEGDNGNIINNLKSYFKEKKFKDKYNTINQIDKNNNLLKLSVEFMRKNYHSQNNY